MSKPYAICIENLYPDIDVSHLCERFGKFGRVLSASIEFNEANCLSLCRGHVRYDNPASITAALKMHGKSNELGKGIAVKRAKDASSAIDNPTEKGSFTKIFVKNFDTNWDDCDLINVFKCWGEVVDVKISETEGKSNGYGYVEFKKHSHAKAAVEGMDNKSVNKKKLIVQPYVEKQRRKATTLDTAKDLVEKSTQFNNLHVKNLSKNVSEEELEALFKGFGPISSVKIPVDETNQSKGFGFVCFLQEADARKALDRMNQYNYKSKILEVNFCQKKAARQQYLHMINSDSAVRKFKGEKELATKPSNVFSFSG